MRSTCKVGGPFNLMVGVELSCNIGVEVSVEFFFGCGELCSLSETILAGCPLRAKKCLEVLVKASADWTWHISRCTARIVLQGIITSFL